jgi:spermidine/putrescine transport system substrate-binding protein
MKRLKFIDQMLCGRMTRREILRNAAAFGVGMAVMPRLPRAAETLTVLDWAGYDAEDYFKPYVAKYGAPPNFSIFASEEEALQKIRSGFAADVMHPCNYSVGRFVEAKLATPIDTSKLQLAGYLPGVADGRRRSGRRASDDGSRRLGQFEHRLSSRPH